ncbi:MAG: SH3 domain-containing protein [Labilithrix sp.]|nr:SH3 domain-containing protein [Labilithrix sp.]MCW5813083.1 SH3 domain-containing protein [Labilithrix sp.]
MKSTVRWVVLGSLLALAAGCAAEPEGAGEEVKEEDFAVLPVDSTSSILSAIEVSEGMPDVCVGMIGYSEAERPAAYARLTAAITSAANQWNALLVGNPMWRLKARISPNYMLQTTECTQMMYTGFNVNIWKDVERFKNEYCAKSNMADGCSAAASWRRRTFSLGPWNRYREVDPLDSFTVLHEYGHLLGLGDTYRILGKNDWRGEQPPSVMNGESATLTEDDKLGLAATLRAVKTGVRSCDGIAKPAQLTSNVFGSILCNPKADPIYTHPGREDEPAIAEPPTGPIPETTLREVFDYEVAAIQLNCRAGAGTEHAVVQKLLQGAAIRSTGRIGYSTEGRPWIQVKANGATCYASASLQFIMPQGPIPYSTIDEIDDYAISTLRLNCRSGPGTEYPVLTEMPMGTRVTIEPDRVRYSTEGNPWIHIRANSRVCYASANFKFLVPQVL